MWSTHVDYAAFPIHGSLSVLTRVFTFNTFARLRWCSENPKFWWDVMRSQSGEIDSEDCEPEPFKQYRIVAYFSWKLEGGWFGKAMELVVMGCLDLISSGAVSFVQNTANLLFAGSLKWRKTRTVGLIWDAQLFPLVRTIKLFDFLREAACAINYSLWVYYSCVMDKVFQAVSSGRVITTRGKH